MVLVIRAGDVDANILGIPELHFATVWSRCIYAMLKHSVLLSLLSLAARYYSCLMPGKTKIGPAFYWSLWTIGILPLGESRSFIGCEELDPILLIYVFRESKNREVK
jgi:hypothetical protein